MEAVWTWLEMLRLFLGNEGMHFSIGIWILNDWIACANQPEQP